MARTTGKKKATKKFDPRSILEPVISNNVSKMAYHEGLMWVLYKGDKLYYFEGFTFEQYGQIRKAESIGKALHQTGVKGKLYVA